MALDVEKVLQELKRRFSEALPEFHQRHIIFWHDEDREFEDKIDDMHLEGVRIVRMTGNNAFEIKKLLTLDDTSSHFLVYSPVTYASDEDNWLLNIELYSGEPFRADIHTIWMEEMGLPSTESLRVLVKRYHKYFNAKDRRMRFASFASGIHHANQMHLGVMACVCGCCDMQPGTIVKTVLSGGLNEAGNVCIKDLIIYGAIEQFKELLKQAIGYSSGELCLLDVAKRILLTASARTLKESCFSGLKDELSCPHQAFCYDLVSEWMHGDTCESYIVLARTIEAETRMFDRCMNLDVLDLIETECFPCIHDVILVKLMMDIGEHHIIRPDVIRKVVEKRRTCVWYEKYAYYYYALLQVAYMQMFYIEHSAGFHITNPVILWNNYTTDYYRMDTYYRAFHGAFGRSMKTNNVFQDDRMKSHLDDLFKLVVERVEGIYSAWFLRELGACWQTASADNLENLGRIEGILYQKNFYSEKVNKADTRIFVVISDALRFEVAASLKEQLERDTQCHVELSSMNAVFPTITPYGMAALLPHRSLSVAENGNGLSVLADGMSTDSGHREQVLKAMNEKSITLQYKSLIGMKSKDRRELIKGMDVVYIYHDKIDESSHASDSSVFTACDEAIDELKSLLKIIYYEFSGTHIYVTADHGFLYTYEPLTEDAKVNKSSWNGKVVDYGRRYAIMSKDASPNYLAPVCFLDGKTAYQAYAPKENIRIKMSGGGLNFVHGGTSLQEMVIPLVDFHYLRNDNKSYQRNKAKIDTQPVMISLVSMSRKVCNMIFSLDFFQKESVGGNRAAATYVLYFADAAGMVVSDKAKIIADKSDLDVTRRTYRQQFNLKSMSFDKKSSYYLVIEDESGVQLPVREEFQIDIAFAVDEFNFF